MCACAVIYQMEIHFQSYRDNAVCLKHQNMIHSLTCTNTPHRVALRLRSTASALSLSLLCLCRDAEAVHPLIFSYAPTIVERWCTKWRCVCVQQSACCLRRADLQRGATCRATRLSPLGLFPVLQCVAVCCSVCHCVAVCCSVLQCVAVYCSVLQCVAACCSVLQCVAA